MFVRGPFSLVGKVVDDKVLFILKGFEGSFRLVSSQPYHSPLSRVFYSNVHIHSTYQYLAQCVS